MELPSEFVDLLGKRAELTAARKPAPTKVRGQRSPTAPKPVAASRGADPPRGVREDVAPDAGA